MDKEQAEQLRRRRIVEEKRHKRNRIDAEKVENLLREDESDCE